ncbi:hypothetical protein [Pectobacterium brasiliense]|uniref:hypothetical protein n=1 Tax=Pectobacterium brasiliense TaxID=180957 RepID=UPI0032EE0024
MLTLNLIGKEVIIKNRKHISFLLSKNHIKNVIIKNKSHSPINEVALLSGFTYLVKELPILNSHESWSCIYSNFLTINTKKPYALMQMRGL